MSKTHCRNCQKTHEGIYMICPSCGFDMLGNATGVPTPQDASLREKIEQWAKANKVFLFSEPTLSSLEDLIEAHTAEAVREASHLHEYQGNMDKCYHCSLTPEQLIENTEMLRHLTQSTKEADYVEPDESFDPYDE